MKTKLLIAAFLFSVTANANPDGTTWIVASKFCDSAPVQILKEEKVLFANGYSVRIHVATEDSSQYCNEGEVYTRLTANFGTNASTYQESSALSPVGRKTQCFSKATSASISSKISSLTGNSLGLTVSMKDSFGTAEIIGSPDCSSGTLRLSLKKQ